MGIRGQTGPGLILVLVGFLGGCGREGDSRPASVSTEEGRALAVQPELGRIDPCSIILVPPRGESPPESEIRRLQQGLKTAADPSLCLEQLGWAFVANARASLDDFYYTLAEHCAACLNTHQPGSCAALLLRGHALHNQHRFKEAEPIARELVARRGLPFDYGLLADVLMELGLLDEAARACQTMLDLRPDLQSYSRGAHIRWLKGDLPGAIELMELAASGASPAAPEAAAWVHGRLAFYHLQSGRFPLALRSCKAALQLQTNYAPALLLQGRILIADGETTHAIEPLRQAAALKPLPEYQWALAEALRAAGRTDEALTVENQLRQDGATADPRTFSLFLATRGDDPETALRLAQAELGARGDVFTHDALAWSCYAAGRMDEAMAHLDKALAEGTRDPRLFFHAAIITSKAGPQDEARRRLTAAFKNMHLLLPSEQDQLLAAAWPSEQVSTALNDAKQ